MSLLFIIKKAVTPFLLPPGCFIVLMIISGFLLIRQRSRKAGGLIILLALFFWLASIGPVADKLMSGIEKGQAIPNSLAGDAIILLGGGIYEKARDLTGQGAPSEEMMSRLVTAVRAQKRLHVPIIISGGAVFAGRTPEAHVVKRFLRDLGVQAEMIIVEDKSRDTAENALFSAAICSRYGFKKPLLVTSAYHMRRSLAAFEKQGVRVTPLPANFKTWRAKEYVWASYLPEAGTLQSTSAALREWIGLLFYRLTM